MIGEIIRRKEANDLLDDFHGGIRDFLDYSLRDEPRHVKDQLFDWYINYWNYTWNHKLSEEFAFYKMETIDGNTIVVPIAAFQTEDLGDILTLAGDVYFPPLFAKQVDWLKRQNTDFRFESKIGEFIIDLTFETFPEHLKHLSQVGRAWKKNPYGQIEALHTRMMLGCLRSNSDYFLAKEGLSDKPDNETLQRFASTMLYLPDKYAQTYHFASGPNVYGYATVVFDDAAREVYWVNTICMRDEQSIKQNFGNYILLKLLEMAYDTYGKGATLNMGLDLFTYKEAWKPRHAYRESAYL